jgi:diadenylate cyclase
MRESGTRFFEQIWALVRDPQLSDAFDVLLLTFLIYGVIRLLRETRSVQLLKGLFFLLAAFGVVGALKMTATRFLFDQVFDNFVLLLLILFQPEIRSMFESMGRSPIKALRIMPNRKREAQHDRDISDVITQVSFAFENMCREKIGALLVFERSTMLGEILKTGTAIDAAISHQLVENIFYPKSPLHDGAVLIREAKLAAAGCILPLTQNPDLPTSLGTRHRAAIGLSEQCDAVVVVASEETGSISVAQKGTLRRELSCEELENLLREALLISGQRTATFTALKSIFAKRGAAKDTQEEKPGKGA